MEKDVKPKWKEKSMTEDVKEEAQPVDEQKESVKAEVATQQGDDKEQNFKALRESRDEWKTKAEQMQAEIDAVKAQQQHAQQPKSKIASYLEGEDDDWMTKSEAKQFRQDMLNEIKTMSAKAKYPDAQQLLNKYAKEVPNSVAQAIAQTGDIEAAIEAVKMTPAYIRDHTTDHINAAKAIENADKPKSALGVGSTAKVSGGTRYDQMSAMERMQMQEKFIRGG